MPTWIGSGPKWVRLKLSANCARGGQQMPIWAWILIILLVVFLLGGFGYSRR
jgi:purine-cytosine permease-like protein